MDLSNIVFLDGQMGGSDVAAQNQEAKADTNAGTQVAADANANSSAPSGFMGIGGIALYIVGLIALFYFFAIRPQKKKEKEHRQKELENEDLSQYKISDKEYKEKRKKSSSSLCT